MLKTSANIADIVDTSFKLKVILHYQKNKKSTIKKLERSRNLPGKGAPGSFGKRMIGFEYEGQVNYITRIEDFRDFMHPSVYEAMVKAFENGCGSDGILQKYEELKQDYEELQSDYKILEDEADDLDYVRDELDECEKKRDEIQEKYNTLTHCIEVLINQYYQKYIKQEDVIYKLERLIQ